MMVRVLITAAMGERGEMVPTEKKIACCVCFPDKCLPGEEGGEGKVVHSRRGRVALRGG